MCFDQERLNVFLNIPFKEQGPIFLAPSKWVKRLGNDGFEYFKTLPDTPLDRHQVRKFCQNSANDCRIAYLCVMAWGNQGVPGPRHAISAWRNREEIAKRLMEIRDGNLDRVASYSLFSGENALPGLGPSYLTKLLYFFSPSSIHYIMDKWTAKSINFLCKDKIVKINEDSPLETNNGKNYDNFCNKIDQLVCLAKERGQTNTGEQIEQRLFSLGGHNPDSWRVIMRSELKKKGPIVNEVHAEKIDTANYVRSKTLGQSKNFLWYFDRDEKEIHIMRNFKNTQRNDKFSIDEVWDVLELLNNHYGTNGFQLANSVTDLPSSKKTDGLGAAHYARKNDTARAQAASQLAAIYSGAGIVSINTNRPLKLALIDDMCKATLCEQLSTAIYDGKK